LNQQDIKWSGSEKKIARRAFEAALDAALERVMSEFKARAVAVATPSDMWDIENYLRQQRRSIDDLFDYRYSQLCFVLAQLIILGHLDERQLAGLSGEKLDIIRGMRDRMRQR
jgi:hypothetical protein